MVSVEDLDWADSCLTKDPDMLEKGWNSLKDALLETLDVQNTPPHERDVSTEMEIVSKNDTVDNSTEEPKSNNEDDSDFWSSHKRDDGDFWSSHKREDVFLPKYDEGSKDLGPIEVDSVFQPYEPGELTGDIFKVWDLDIPPEEDEGLIKQLNKALGGDYQETTPLVSDEDSKAWKGLRAEESLDDVISGLEDLSLSPNNVD